MNSLHIPRIPAMLCTRNSATHLYKLTLPPAQNSSLQVALEIRGAPSTRIRLFSSLARYPPAPSEVAPSENFFLSNTKMQKKATAR